MKRGSIIYRLLKYRVFSSKYLVLGVCLLFVASKENINIIPDNTPRIIQNASSYSELKFERNTIAHAMFPIQYIGSNTGVITLNKVDSLKKTDIEEQKNTYSSYLISRTDLMSYIDTLSPDVVKAPTPTKKDSFNIIVDTTQIFETKFIEYN